MVKLDNSTELMERKMRMLKEYMNIFEMEFYDKLLEIKYILTHIPCICKFVTVFSPTMHCILLVFVMFITLQIYTYYILQYNH